MEVGPFRMVAASQTESGKVEARLVEGGWEEFATIVFSKLGVSRRDLKLIDSRSASWDWLLVCPDQWVPPRARSGRYSTTAWGLANVQGSQHLIKFLDNFYHVFPELKSQDVSQSDMREGYG
jgi:carboxypeptidase D